MLIYITEVIVGLVLLIWGADRFVHGAAAAARNLGVAPLMIGCAVNRTWLSATRLVQISPMSGWFSVLLLCSNQSN
jgi:cation:H+ antiporter